ncbi:Gfo/Idh/MocA family oxidoreductase [Allopusillimonas soli]|uniref:Gfo/Idh/MocA family oxidoreductase n=1 Tax=Allopusillimonas soli TaxID=659016 RepID=A0A853FBR6_9BURK|nr:Gfo/Idh/MocA family oxidoreductase [Allopusillimonas soli]NYT38224.1 Gfo/Idh/MocA family oxidoreductase [Allopusillimonas soli]TEA72197.1 Gfo/Idh/MocA family oxidoreductase [Allopusillimonas soli]
MMGKKLKWGMVGGGQGAFIGAVHRMAARLDDRYELLAGALSSRPEKSAASAAEAGIASERSYLHWQEMAECEGALRRAGQGGIDVVSIVTPNHLHAPVASAFLAQGIHVICDKPLAISLAQAEMLQAQAARSGLVCVLTHTYTGYPMVRHARELVRQGAIGELRLLQVEYAQDWWAGGPAITGEGAWREDPAMAGPAGTLGDVGVHAYQLAAYVSGVEPSHLAAELSTFGHGRVLDDHVQVMLRYANGARGTLWASQVATGCENALTLRIYGTHAQLRFEQENPNELWLTPQGGAAQRLTRGRVQGQDALHATRIPAGHPEGYIEAFAQLYRDAADRIQAGGRGSTPEGLLPDFRDGVMGHRFIQAVLDSSHADSAWVSLA